MFLQTENIYIYEIMETKSAETSGIVRKLLFMRYITMSTFFQPSILSINSLLLRGTNISHIQKRKLIFPTTFERDMLPRRVSGAGFVGPALTASFCFPEVPGAPVPPY